MNKETKQTPQSIQIKNKSHKSQTKHFNELNQKTEIIEKNISDDDKYLDEYDEDIYGEYEDISKKISSKKISSKKPYLNQYKNVPQLSDLYNPRYVGACCDMTILILNGKLNV